MVETFEENGKRHYKLWSVQESGAEVEQFQMVNEKELESKRGELHLVVGRKT